MIASGRGKSRCPNCIIKIEFKRDIGSKAFNEINHGYFVGMAVLDLLVSRLIPFNVRIIFRGRSKLNFCNFLANAIASDVGWSCKIRSKSSLSVSNRTASSLS